MTRSEQDRITDILNAIAQCRIYQKYAGSGNIELDQMVIDAIIQNIIIIGEAARHLSDDVKARHPAIAWSSIIGTRNVLVHQYFGIDLEIIAQVLDDHLAPLAAALEEERRT